MWREAAVHKLSQTASVRLRWPIVAPWILPRLLLERLNLFLRWRTVAVDGRSGSHCRLRFGTRTAALGAAGQSPANSAAALYGRAALESAAAADSYRPHCRTRAVREPNSPVADTIGEPEICLQPGFQRRRHGL